jgi:hypothetical protein
MTFLDDGNRLSATRVEEELDHAGDLSRTVLSAESDQAGTAVVVMTSS